MCVCVVVCKGEKKGVWLCGDRVIALGSVYRQMGSVPEGGERGIAGELWWGGKGERFKRTFLSRRILSVRSLS